MVEVMMYFHACFKTSLLLVVAVLPNLLNLDLNNIAEAFVKSCIAAK